MKKSIISCALLALSAGLPAAAAGSATALPSALMEGLEEYLDETSGYYFRPLDGTQFGDWLRSKYGNYLLGYENICAVTGIEKSIVAGNIKPDAYIVQIPYSVEKMASPIRRSALTE